MFIVVVAIMVLPGAFVEQLLHLHLEPSVLDLETALVTLGGIAVLQVALDPLLEVSRLIHKRPVVVVDTIDLGDVLLGLALEVKEQLLDAVFVEHSSLGGVRITVQEMVLLLTETLEL